MPRAPAPAQQSDMLFLKRICHLGCAMLERVIDRLRHVREEWPSLDGSRRSKQQWRHLRQPHKHHVDGADRHPGWRCADHSFLYRGSVTADSYPANGLCGRAGADVSSKRYWWRLFCRQLYLVQNCQQRERKLHDYACDSLIARVDRRVLWSRHRRAVWPE